MHTRVAQIVTALQRNLALTDLLMNPDNAQQKEVTLTNLTGFLGHCIEYLYVYYLCKLLIYGH